MLDTIVTTVTNNPIRYAAPVVAGVFLLVTFAHWELSAINPATALGHYRGKSDSPTNGEKRLENRLPNGSLVEKPVRPGEKRQQAQTQPPEQHPQPQQPATAPASQ